MVDSSKAPLIQTGVSQPLDLKPVMRKGMMGTNQASGQTDLFGGGGSPIGGSVGTEFNKPQLSTSPIMSSQNNPLQSQASQDLAGPIMALQKAQSKPEPPTEMFGTLPTLQTQNTMQQQPSSGRPQTATQKSTASWND